LGLVHHHWSWESRFALSAKEDGVPEKAGHTEMMEQSLIILQVAMELEEYARTARKITLLSMYSRVVDYSLLNLLWPRRRRDVALNVLKVFLTFAH
jgi:hypothetical protein